MSVFNDIYKKRGEKFDVADYPAATQTLIREKLKPVEQIISELPRRFRFYSTFAMSQARGFLRKLAIRDDYEEVRAFSAMTLEPYAFIQDPAYHLVSAYFSPLDRFVAEQMGKTVAHLPRQFIQFADTLKQEGVIDVFVHTAAPPDSEGYVNLGVNCEILPECLDHFVAQGRVRIILEINSHVPWVQGHPECQHNRLHLSAVSAIYEHHERLFQLPPIEASEAEQRIARHVLPFIEDGDALQLGIGGVPNYIAEQLAERRHLRIHSEMLTDAVVDLAHAGALAGVHVVGAFAAGTDKLYDWIDRNPAVMLLPIRKTNDSHVIGDISRMKSINSALMVDLLGQVYSDAAGFRQISGIGGQLEFVIGAQLSAGGRSILCLKSTRRVGRREASSIVLTPPVGTPVTVPRHYADTIITEHGVAELKHLDSIERAQALVQIAHPRFRDELAAKARRAGLWQRRCGFTRLSQRAMFNNLAYLRRVKTALAKAPSTRAKAGVIVNEVLALVARPDVLKRALQFYERNRVRRRQLPPEIASGRDPSRSR